MHRYFQVSWSVILAVLVVLILLVLLQYDFSAADRLAPDSLPCEIRAITVTANLGWTPGVSDTMACAEISRTVFFAPPPVSVGTVVLDGIRLSVLMSMPIGVNCTLDAALAFSTTLPQSATVGAGSPVVNLLYAVSPRHLTQTILLEYYPAGSDSPPYPSVVLTFTPDLEPPILTDLAIDAMGAPFLFAAGTTLYYTQTGSSAPQFTLDGQSSDNGSGVARTAFITVPLDTVSDFTQCGASLPSESAQPVWSTRYCLQGLPQPGVITVTAYDQVGNPGWAVFDYKPDSYPPTSSVTTTVSEVAAGVPFSLTWAAEDAESGVYSVSLMVKQDAGNWQLYTDVLTRGALTGIFVFTSPRLLSAPVVTYSFASVAKDNAGNIELLPPVPDVQVRVRGFQIYLPLTLKNFPPVPSGSVMIDNAAVYTYRRTVTLGLTATVQSDVVSQVRLRNEGESWGAWQVFTTSVPYTLPAGNGRKTVYAQFQGAQGGMSPETSDSILLFENGDMEQGLGVAWQNENGGLPVLPVTLTTDATPVTGTAALLGNPDYACDGVPPGYAGVAQTAQVPLTGGKLKFQYFIRTQDASQKGVHDFDAFEVYVDGTRVWDDANRYTGIQPQCNRWYRVPGPDNVRHGLTAGWVEETIDLSSYAGRTVTLSFRDYSRYDKYYNTYTYLDNVRLEP